jgi:hypothetical protein
MVDPAPRLPRTRTRSSRRTAPLPSRRIFMAPRPANKRGV